MHPRLEQIKREIAENWWVGQDGDTLIVNTSGSYEEPDDDYRGTVRMLDDNTVEFYPGEACESDGYGTETGSADGFVAYYDELMQEGYSGCESDWADG